MSNSKSLTKLEKELSNYKARKVKKFPLLMNSYIPTGISSIPVVPNRCISYVSGVVFFFDSVWLIATSEKSKFLLSEVSTGSRISKSSLFGGREGEWSLSDFKMLENNKGIISSKFTSHYKKYYTEGVPLKSALTMFPQIANFKELITLKLL